MSTRALAVLGALLLTLFSAGPAAADLAPGLFGGQPPPGIVRADNTLTMPRGQPKGFVLVIHGGAWVITGPQALAQEAPKVRWLTRLGWAVYNVDYRAGWLSVVDVVAAYDHLRSLYPAAPMCAYGESAGGQLAMLLAASRPSLRCVISAGGVTDLTDVAGSLRVLEDHVFHDRLWEFSPVRLTSHIHGTLLCAAPPMTKPCPRGHSWRQFVRPGPKHASCSWPARPPLEGRLLRPAQLRPRVDYNRRPGAVQARRRSHLGRRDRPTGTRRAVAPPHTLSGWGTRRTA